MTNLVPLSNSSLIKSNKTSILKTNKLLRPSSKIVRVSPKATEGPKLLDNPLLKIEKQVIQIDKVLKDMLSLQRKQSEKQRVGQEQKDFTKKEKELESKRPKEESKIKLPTPPAKLGFFGWIKNFITKTILGFFAVRLIDFLPQLLKILPVVISAGDFLIDWGGKLLDGLVTFVDWGYKAIDGTRQFIKNMGGESWAQNFDKFAGAVDNIIEIAIIAALATAGSAGDDGFGGGRPRPGRGFDSTGRRVGVDAQRRYAQRFGKDQFLSRFGKKNLINLGEKGASKSILRFVRPFTKRLPIIGALLDFGLSVALGENPGRAAFKAIGAGLLGSVGAAVGSIVPFAGTFLGGLAGGVAGDMAGGALYDMFFGGGKPKQLKQNKLAGGGTPKNTTSTKSNTTPSRKIKKKKKPRTVSFIPRKITPGRNTGGEDKVQKVFPNPNKPGGFFGWFQSLIGGKTQQQTQQNQKPKEKTTNTQEFLIKSNDILGKADFFGPFFTLAIKTVLGDKPGKLDYLNVGKGLNAWMQGVFKTGLLGFAGGGEVDAREFFEGEDYTNVISKSVEDSVSTKINTTITDLAKELSLRSPVGREEMIQENIRRGREGDETSEPISGGGLTPGQWGPLLDVIASGEGGYESVNPSFTIPGLTKMTIADAWAQAKRMGRARGGSGAMGRYQLLSDPIGRAKAAGLNPNKDLFSPANQDKIAVHILENIRDGKKWIAGKISDQDFMQLIANEWAAMPNYYGKYSYSGQGGKVKSDKVKEALKKVKRGGYSKQELDAVDSVSVESLKDVKGYRVTRSGKTIRNYSELPPHHTYQTTKDGRRVQDFTLYKGEKFVNVPVPSPVSGKVTWTGDAGGGGKWVEIQSSRGKVELGHFNKINVKQNQTVSAFSSVLGLQGYTGNIRPPGPDGTHVHIQAPDKVIGNYVNTLAKGSKFHGGVGIVPKGGLKLTLHEGEMYKVIDKDSVSSLGFDLTKEIIDIENRSQLVARAPSIIEKLKAISGYTDYERPYSEPEVVFIPLQSQDTSITSLGTHSGSLTIEGGIDNSMSEQIRDNLMYG